MVLARAMYMFSWDMFGEYMCICGVSHLELEEGIILPFMFPPLTCTGEYDKDALRETIFMAKEYFEKKDQPFSLRLVPFHLVEIIREAVPELRWEDDRPNYDYIYLTQDLIDLKGRNYHGKKNHLNYFLETLDNSERQGKKLGFITQEMGREINTTGSKSNHAEMQKIVVEMKDNLEQIKEQVLNVL